MMLPNVQRRQPIYFNIKFLFQKKKILYFSNLINLKQNPIRFLGFKKYNFHYWQFISVIIIHMTIPVIISLVIYKYFILLCYSLYCCYHNNLYKIEEIFHFIKSNIPNI